MIRRGFTYRPSSAPTCTTRRHDDAFNSAILLDGDGRVAGRYDKVRLLAFGEYIPGIDTFPWLRKFLPAGTGRFTAGAGPARADSLQAPAGKIWRLGPVICYEDILQGFLRERRKAAPQSARQSDQRLMVRRRHRTLGTSGAVGVRQRRAARQHGARRQFRRFRPDRSERPAAAENLRRRSLSQPAIRRRHRGQPRPAWRAATPVRGRGQFVRLSVPGRDAARHWLCVASGPTPAIRPSC